MTKKKSKSVNDEPKLSKEAIAAMEHFFSCFPPKYFSRNLRRMVVDWMESNVAGGPDYDEELLSQLSLFFPVLDLIEDEGQFEQEAPHQ